MIIPERELDLLELRARQRLDAIYEKVTIAYYGDRLNDDNRQGRSEPIQHREEPGREPGSSAGSEPATSEPQPY